jgi:hypothetical protein
MYAFTQLESAIADLHSLQFTVTHALGFSAFTSHILATDLSQSHCNLKSHMESSCHFFLITLDCHLQNSAHLLTAQFNSKLISRQAGVSSLYAAEHFL